MTLTALIQDREIASKEIPYLYGYDFRTRVRLGEQLIKSEIIRIKESLNGDAHKVRFMITAQSKMNKL